MLLECSEVLPFSMKLICDATEGSSVEGTGWTLAHFSERARSTYVLPNLNACSFWEMMVLYSSLDARVLTRSSCSARKRSLEWDISQDH